MMRSPSDLSGIVLEISREDWDIAVEINTDKKIAMNKDNRMISSDLDRMM
jgi:hypothetical protein